MKNLCRSAALAALSVSLSAFAAPPAAPAPAAAPAAAAPKGPTAYPLSCNAAAKPLVLAAWEAQATGHEDDARAGLKQALAADAKCAMAKASLGQMTPGSEGKTMFDEAMAMPGLTELEKLDLQATDLARKGDSEKSWALRVKARDLAPTVAIVSISLSFSAQALQKWDDAIAAAKKATELDPKSGAAWNVLGYGYIGAHKSADAVAALQKYAEIAPTDANAHDSLADAMLGNNQVDEAGGEYQKAIDVSAGKFWTSFDGLAAVKAIKGDWDGARAACSKAKEGATEPSAKIRYDRWAARAWLAQGKAAEAYKALDAADKALVAAKLDGQLAWGPIIRADFFMHEGKYAEALKQAALAEKIKVDALTDGQKLWHSASRLTEVIQAQSRLGKVADAEKALVQLEAVVAPIATDSGAKDTLAFARGLIALGKKDAKAAVESLSKCSEFADDCHVVLAEAQDKAGDATAANETRLAVLKANRRDAAYWTTRVAVEKAIKTPGKKVAGGK